MESVERFSGVPIILAFVVCFVDSSGFIGVIDEVGSEETCEAVGEGFFGVRAEDLPGRVVDDGESEGSVFVGLDGGCVGVEVEEVGDFADFAAEESYELDEVELEGFLGVGVFGGTEVVEVLRNVFNREFIFAVGHDVAAPFPYRVSFGLGCLWCGCALQQAGVGAGLVAGLPVCVTLGSLALEEYLFELIHLFCGVGQVRESSVAVDVSGRVYCTEPHFLHVRTGVAEHAEGYGVETLVAVMT